MVRLEVLNLSKERAQQMMLELMDAGISFTFHGNEDYSPLPSDSNLTASLTRNMAMANPTPPPSADYTLQVVDIGSDFVDGHVKGNMTASLLQRMASVELQHSNSTANESMQSQTQMGEQQQQQQQQAVGIKQVDDTQPPLHTSTPRLQSTDASGSSGQQTAFNFPAPATQTEVAQPPVPCPGPLPTLTQEMQTPQRKVKSSKLSSKYPFDALLTRKPTSPTADSTAQSLPQQAALNTQPNQANTDMPVPMQHQQQPTAFASTTANSASADTHSAAKFTKKWEPAWLATRKTELAAQGKTGALEATLKTESDAVAYFSLPENRRPPIYPSQQQQGFGSGDGDRSRGPRTTRPGPK